jgi:hypothetical protein
MVDDRPSERGREPGNWELMRGIERLEKRFDAAASGFVSVEVHRLLAERVQSVEASVSTVRAEAEADVEKAKLEAAAALATVRTELDNAKKQRLQTWTAIGLLFASGIAALIINVFSRGLGLS